MLCPCPSPVAAHEPADAPRYGGMAIALHWLLALMIGIVQRRAVHGRSASRRCGQAGQLAQVGRRHDPGAVGAAPALAACAQASAAAAGDRVRHARLAAVRPPSARIGIAYVLFFAVPLFGWAYSSALGLPLVWFGVLPLPDFVPVDKALAESVLLPLHRGSAFLLAALVVAHTTGALKHHFVDRDGLLARMWPAARQGIR